MHLVPFILTWESLSNEHTVKKGAFLNSNGLLTNEASGQGQDVFVIGARTIVLFYFEKLLSQNRES